MFSLDSNVKNYLGKVPNTTKHPKLSDTSKLSWFALVPNLAAVNSEDCHDDIISNIKNFSPLFCEPNRYGPLWYPQIKQWKMVELTLMVYI